VTYLFAGGVRVENLVQNTGGEMEEPMEMTLSLESFFERKSD
jgi:hypothetical protein